MRSFGQGMSLGKIFLDPQIGSCPPSLLVMKIRKRIREMLRGMNVTREKGMKRTERMRRMVRIVRMMREHLLPIPSSFLRYGSSMIFTRRCPPRRSISFVTITKSLRTSQFVYPESLNGAILGRPQTLACMMPWSWRD